MNLPKEKSADAARLAKRRLENLLTEAQKVEKAAVNAERIHEIQRTVDRNSERLRVMAERRSVAGAEGLAAKASRNSTRRKLHPLTVEEKAEKARLEAERRSAAGAESLAAEATRNSGRRKANPLTDEQKAKKAVANATRYRQSRLNIEKKQKMLELITRDKMRKVHKLHRFDYSISVIVTRLDLRQLPIPLLRMH